MAHKSLLAATALVALFTLPTIASADRRGADSPGLEVLATPFTVTPAILARSWLISPRDDFRAPRQHHRFRRHAQIPFNRDTQVRRRILVVDPGYGISRGHDGHRLHARHRVVVKSWPVRDFRHPLRHGDHPGFAPRRY